MIADVLGALACPLDAVELALDGDVVRCATGHAFDVARQGYVNLLPGDARPLTADTAAMVAARAAFLAAGHYRPLAARLTAVVAATDAEGCVADVGAGTGYHLAAGLDAAPGRAGLALDASAPALRRAARAHPRIGAAVCDAWARLPVRDGAAAVVLNVFAPRDAAELARILAPDGALVIATATSRHLAELVGALGLVTVDPRKPERLAAAFDPHVTLVDAEVWEAELALPHDDVAALVAMGPSARHTDPVEVMARLRALPDPVRVTAAVRVAIHRHRRAAQRRPGAS